MNRVILKNLILTIVFIVNASISSLSSASAAESLSASNEAEREHKVLFISGHTNALGAKDPNDVIDPSGNWGSIRNFLTTSPANADVRTTYLTEKLQREGIEILIFSYSTEYHKKPGTDEDDYGQPKYVNIDTDPCPKRANGTHPNRQRWFPRKCKESDLPKWNIWANHINELLDTFENAQFDIIAHSHGGAVAAYWAGREKKQADNEDSERRLAQVNSIITLNSPFKGWINVCNFLSGQLYSDSAKEVIEQAPAAVPMFTISDRRDGVVSVSDSSLPKVWTRIIDEFGGGDFPSLDNDCFHRPIRDHRNVSQWVTEAMNAGEIINPFTPPGYTGHIIALAGQAEAPLPRLLPDIEIIKPGYTIDHSDNPSLRILIDQDISNASISPVPPYDEGELHYSFPLAPPKQDTNELHDLQISSEGHITNSSLMVDSVSYDDSALGLDIVLILDRSGSMDVPSPQKFQDTKDAAKLFVDLMSEADRLGLVAFETTAVPVTGFSSLQPIDSNKREEAKSTIQALSTAGATSLGSGLLEAIAILNRSTSIGKRVFVLLTDGGENTAECWQPANTTPGQIPNVQRQVLESGTTVFTIALGQLSQPGQDCASGNPDARLLEIANSTSGEFTKADRSTELLGVFNRIFNEVVGRQSIVDVRLDLQVGSRHEEIVQVVPGTSDLAFFIGWTGTSGSFVSSITGPSGPIVLPTPNIYQAQGPNYIIYNINVPEPGVWKFTVDALSGGISAANTVQNIPVDIMISVIDSVDANVEFDAPSQQYKVHDPVTLKVALQDTKGPLTNAEVTGEVMIPTISAANVWASDFGEEKEQVAIEALQGYLEHENQSLKLHFFDDGTHGDSNANDGIYATVFNDTLVSGSYDFDIMIEGVTNDNEVFRRTVKTSAIVNDYLSGENPPADLSVMITKDDLSPAAPGAELNYCVTFANIGPGTAKSVGTYLGLPENAVIVADTLNSRKDGLHDTSALWLVDDLPRGEYQSFNVAVQVPDSYSTNEPFEVYAGVASGVNETEISISGAQYSSDRNLSNDHAVASELTSVQLTLDAGWNLVSVPVESGGIHPAGLLCNLHGDYSVVLGFDDSALTFDPNLPGLFNTLQNIDGLHAYWINSNQSITIPFSNSRLNLETTEYRLKKGWNFISYLPSTPVEVNKALSSIYDKVEIVLGYDKGAMSFYSSLPPQLSNLGVMEAGNGYLVKMKEPATLRYTQETSELSNANISAINKPQTPPGVITTNEWINVYSMNSTYNNKAVPSGSLITAIGEDGRKLGEVIVQQSGSYGVLSIYGDDTYTQEKDGAIRGEQIRFLINNQPSEVTNNVIPAWTVNGDLIEVNLAASGPGVVELSHSTYLPLISQ